MSDYKTIAQKSEGFFKEKGSKFLAFAHNINSDTEAKKIVHKYKTDYPTARHHCYAYRLGVSGDKFRSYDDGEPGGTAGKPILNQLLSNELTNIIIVIVRYFGGTKLGVSGLIHAYKEASIDAIENSNLLHQFVSNYYSLDFSYEQMPSVMSWVKQHKICVIKQEFNLNCTLEIKIRQFEAEQQLNSCPRNIKTNLLRSI